MQSNCLANRIYELRKAKGLSQKELGALVGVSNKAVSKWETGAAVPKTEILLKLAEVFEVNAQVFLEQALPEAESPIAEHRTLYDVARSTDDILQSGEEKTVRVSVMFSGIRAKVYLAAVAVLTALSLWLAQVVYTNVNIWIPDDVNVSFITPLCVLVGVALPSLFTGLWYLVFAVRRMPFWMQILCLFAGIFMLYFSVLAGGLLLLPSIGIAIAQCVKKRG